MELLGGKIDTLNFGVKFGIPVFVTRSIVACTCTTGAYAKAIEELITGGSIHTIPVKLDGIVSTVNYSRAILVGFVADICVMLLAEHRPRQTVKVVNVVENNVVFLTRSYREGNQCSKEI